MDKKAILIFGVGSLQKSLIERCKLKGLYTIGIDPDENASCKENVDTFEIVNGQDFEGTLFVAKKYNISGLITAATDKPLVMMARVAQALNLPFYSVETAEWSTDKLLMKQKFQENGIPCAKGKLITCLDDIGNFNYPLILKPRDNSGSRGVIYCNNYSKVKTVFSEVKRFTKKDSILIEEFIEGREYSIETLHFNGKSEIIQYTEKITTPLPYNVELGHIQPASLSPDIKKEINSIITKIGSALGFINCASHTELKINERGIYVIETSPRLGGDYITSNLVPLSTGVNMEELLLKISVGEEIEIKKIENRFSAVIFFDLSKTNLNINKLKENITEMKDYITSFEFYYSNLKDLPLITNSMNRHGHIIFSADTIEEFLPLKNKLNAGI